MTREQAKRVEFFPEAGMMTLLIVLMVIAMRGGLQQEPLRWGNAYHSTNDFVNQMSLNGLFALGQSGLDHIRHSKTTAWQRKMPIGEAREIARKLVVSPSEQLLDPGERTVLRKGVPTSSLVTLNRRARAPNRHRRSPAASRPRGRSNRAPAHGR